MRKKLGFFLVAAGAVLILSALSLFLYNTIEDKKAGAEAESVLNDILALVETTASVPTTARPEEAVTPEGESPAPTEPDNSPMTEVMIGGHAYIGYLNIPVLELELPVMSTWSDYKLQIAPCRQLGSTKTDDLVIAAHNFPSHFGKLKDMRAGDVISFTDMDGVTIWYEVSSVHVIDPIWTDFVEDSGNDLVLYTCTVGGLQRVCVFADRSELTWESNHVE